MNKNFKLSNTQSAYQATSHKIKIQNRQIYLSLVDVIDAIMLSS